MKYFYHFGYGTQVQSQEFSSFTRQYNIGSSYLQTVPYFIASNSIITVDASLYDSPDCNIMSYENNTIQLSDGKVLSASAEYLLLDGVVVPFYIFDKYMVLVNNSRISIFPFSEFGSVSSSCPSVAPFNRMVGSHYVFEIVDSFELDFGSAPTRSYRSGSLIQSPNVTFHYDASSFTISYFARLIFDYYSDCSSFEFIHSGFSDGRPRNVVILDDFYLRVGNRIFRSYVDAVLYINQVLVNDVHSPYAIDTTQLFYKDELVIDYGSETLEYQIELLQNDLSSLNSLKDSILSEKESLAFQKATLEGDLLVCQQSKSSLETALSEAYSTLSQLRDDFVASEISSKMAVLNLSESESYYQQKIENLRSSYDSEIVDYEQRISQLKTMILDRSQLSVPETLTSLNGNGCEHRDGAIVAIEGRSGSYVVYRSYSLLVEDNNYTVCYDLVAEDGRLLSAPEAMLVVSSVVEGQGVV